MKVSNIRTTLKNNKFRLSAQIVIDNGRSHEIYFEVDKEFKNFVSTDANSLLAAAMPIAMIKKEDIKVDGPVSRKLMSNIPKIMNIFSDWNLGFYKTSIGANSLNIQRKHQKYVGCFFSAGVDSFYTYLKNKHKIDYLIFVHGFDISIANLRLYKSIDKNIAVIAKKENVKLLRVKTNIREIFEHYFDWELSNNFALVSVSNFLGNGFGEIYMSCGQTALNAKHRYMSPDLDPLWSTESMRIIHYGCDADKILKLKYLSKNELARRTLRVCWTNKKNQYNCCECEKCLRNMLALYASGSLEKFVTFNKKIDLRKLRKIVASEYVLRYFVAVLETLKKNGDDSEVTYVLEEFIQSNRFPKLPDSITRSIRRAMRYIDKTFNQNRFYWYLTSRGLI